MWLPPPQAPELPAEPTISPRERGGHSTETVLPGAPLPPLAGPPNSHHVEREILCSGSLPWSELPAGEEEVGAGPSSVPRLGSCVAVQRPLASQAFMKWGVGRATGPGPSPELAGQLEANRKVP